MRRYWLPGPVQWKARRGLAGWWPGVMAGGGVASWAGVGGGRGGVGGGGAGGGGGGGGALGEGGEGGVVVVGDDGAVGEVGAGGGQGACGGVDVLWPVCGEFGRLTTQRLG